jgi:hypothetical protein
LGSDRMGSSHRDLERLPASPARGPRSAFIVSLRNDRHDAVDRVCGHAAAVVNENGLSWFE